MVCTGDKVVASEVAKEEIINLLETHSYYLRAIEMEGAAILRAITFLPKEIRPDFGMVRGICDDATHTKNDDWHKIAAKFSAKFAVDFCRYHIPLTHR